MTASAHQEDHVSLTISLDCEANGLHGTIFAAAATVYDNGKPVDQWEERCPIYGDVDPWVAENVLPAIADMPQTVAYYDQICSSWRTFYEANTFHGTLVIAHVPWPIEARFLWDAHRTKPRSGPFPLIDVASVLLAHGHDPAYVDSFLVERGAPLPSGSPHHPLYDCQAAAQAYFELVGTGRA